MNIPICRTRQELFDITSEWRQRGHKLAVVPTMGALHAGHLSLVEAAAQHADKVIVTLFVNPKQFDNSEDLEAYPDTERSDAKKLAPLGVELLYIPDISEIYPPGFSTTVTIGGFSDSLCGAGREGHFDGVATVVTKLLLQTQAHYAMFGEKDYQQLQLVQRLVLDLDLPVTIVPCPTVRESDGLAMSSRNVHLQPADRAIAPHFYKTLQSLALQIREGEDIHTSVAKAQSALESAGFSSVEYIEIRRNNDLSPISGISPTSKTNSVTNKDGVACTLCASALELKLENYRVLAAVWLGDTRLIDNLPLA